MTTIPISPLEIAQLCHDAKFFGIDLTERHADQLLRKTTDRELLVDILLMTNRPDWLTKLLST
jgi:hypothetical protein